ncbi:hypothetical protein AB0H88_02265 [Nonomuraea sp. NPDC050680]|uniref:hypothetical protein n=1 Tax=Nonomuraea sp. NPDC050680 TaxID=3154630 RepID=UPI0033D4B51F
MRRLATFAALALTAGLLTVASPASDDAVTPKATMQVLNPIIALFQDLPMKDRRALVELINQCAHEKIDP